MTTKLARILVLFGLCLLVVVLLQAKNYMYKLKFYSDIPDDKVTRIIHMSWKSYQLPPRQTKWFKSWQTCFPDFKIMFWNDTDNRNLIVEHYPWALTHYDGLHRMIMKADFLRFFYLHLYGGIYTDVDNECFTNFVDLLKGHRIMFGAMEGNSHYLPEGYVQNSFMYSQPRENFWLEAIHFATQTPRNVEPEHVAGPITLMKVINEFRKRFKDVIKIYEPNYFNPFSWITKQSPCKALDRMTDDELKNCRKFHNTSYVIQYHAHTW